MANPNPKTDHLKHKLTRKEQSMGGKKSAEVRKEKRKFIEAVEWLANSDFDISKGSIYKYFKEKNFDTTKLDNTQLSAIGLWIGSLYGNATNFKTLMECNNEIEIEGNNTTPVLKIEVVDNSKLEGTLYEENRHNKNDDSK